MNIETVNELIQSLESAGELSIKERKYLDIMRWAVGVAGERDAALNAERVWKTAMMEVCGEDGPASVASEIRSLQALRDTAMQALKSQVEQMAAENVAIREQSEEVYAAGYNRGHLNTVDGIAYAGCVKDDFYSLALQVMAEVETSATDRFVAEAEARGLEKAREIVRACHDNICPGGLAENRQYEEAIVQPHLDGISDELDFEIEQLRDGADK